MVPSEHIVFAYKEVSSCYGETWPRSSPSSTRGPETDMSWPGLAKSYSNSLLIRNIYRSPWHDSPQCLCYMNIRTWTSLGYRLNSTCKSSACSMPGKTNHVRVTTMERLDQGHLHRDRHPCNDGLFIAWSKVEWTKHTTLRITNLSACLSIFQT
jgi:hypothetical protein